MLPLLSPQPASICEMVGFVIVFFGGFALAVGVLLAAIRVAVYGYSGGQR